MPFRVIEAIVIACEANLPTSNVPDTHCEPMVERMHTLLSCSLLHHMSYPFSVSSDTHMSACTSPSGAKTEMSLLYSSPSAATCTTASSTCTSTSGTKAVSRLMFPMASVLYRKSVETSEKLLQAERMARAAALQSARASLYDGTHILVQTIHKVLSEWVDQQSTTLENAIFCSKVSASIPIIEEVCESLQASGFSVCYVPDKNGVYVFLMYRPDDKFVNVSGFKATCPSMTSRVVAAFSSKRYSC